MNLHFFFLPLLAPCFFRGVLRAGQWGDVEMGMTVLLDD